MKLPKISIELCLSAALLSLAAAACAPVEDGDEDATEIASVEQSLTTTFTPVAFSMSKAYNATGLLTPFTCSGLSARSLVGHEPAQTGRYPVAVWLTGTQADYKGSGALAFTASMAARGFVAASVEYDNGLYTTCSGLKTKASCVFNAGSSSSAISKLCSRPKADCSKGIVVAGISQGANLASMAKNYDGRARGAYLVSNVVTPSLFINSSCLSDGATSFAKNQVRSISGEADEMLGSLTKVRSDLVLASGYSCSGNSCLQSDGSGWYIVANSQVADRTADHCYLLNGGCKSTTADPTYERGTDVWAGTPNVNWLARRIYP